jgi:putative CocE/NonD family hydrolase
MRDGVKLFADVRRPDTEQPVPVLLMRTPYSRALLAAGFPLDRMVRAGFGVVLQDCRGCFESEGRWTYVRGDIEDGYDTVEWAARQPWSDGRVGMFGPSYMGNTQWMAAISGAPQLEVIAPACCPSDLWTGSFDTGGAFRLGLRVSWAAGLLASMASKWDIEDERLERLSSATLDLVVAEFTGDDGGAVEAAARARDVLEPLYAERPVGSSKLWRDPVTVVDELAEHERRSDSWWRRVAPSTYYDVLDLPALHVGGWYDIHLGGTLTNFAGMRRQAPTARAREGQRLVVGPWGHWRPDRTTWGDVDFGPAAALDIAAMELAWYRHWLQDAPDPGWAPVRIFVMGENQWRDEHEWPLARTEFTPWYLHSGGVLAPRRPDDGDAEPDRFSFDPAHPVPTLGGRLLSTGEPAGPRDQRTTLSRPDVVAYRSEPLACPMEITGPVVVDLWAATDAPDTDFTATVIDEHPDDGPALNLCEGAVRARQTDIPMPLISGAVYRFTVDLVATSAVVDAGHRVTLLISSSRFPEWEPNPNTGHRLGADSAADLRVAAQAVFHDPGHPSCLVLPVIPRSDFG